MLSVDRIDAWIAIDGQRVNELKTVSRGDTVVGFIVRWRRSDEAERPQEAREGSRFEIGFRIEPPGEHDYAIRACVDGTINTSRAMCRTEHERTSSIDGVPVTFDGSKMQPFRFAATGSSASSLPTALIALEEPDKARKLSLGPSSSPVKAAVGTIRIAMTRCTLERVQNVSSDHRPSIADASARAASTPATHVTRLGTLAFDTPRKAYRVRADSEHAKVR